MATTTPYARVFIRIVAVVHLLVTLAAGGVLFWVFFPPLLRAVLR